MALMQPAISGYSEDFFLATQYRLALLQVAGLLFKIPF
jgi:hypothetical protein